MKKAVVIPLHNNSAAPPCDLKPSCPIYIHNINDDIEAAAYTIITASGQVVNGAHKVKPHHLADLLRAMDLLALRLRRALAT